MFFNFLLCTAKFMKRNKKLNLKSFRFQKDGRQMQKLELKILSQEIRGYQTFHKLINKLKESYSMKAIKFLHQYLLDAIVFTKVPDQHDHLIEFLAAEGVLTPADSFLNKVRLSFPFVGIYIKMDVLSELFSHISRSEIPLDKDQKLDILKMLQVIVTFFDVKLIHLAPLCCFKKATVPVNGKNGRKIPRENTYDQELIRILKNWLASYTIIGQ
ncbi:8193_t:CDS:2 [Funneliformis geosporum]|nr:8193_t:CDS:2 [Funneliformis geosporum]